MTSIDLKKTYHPLYAPATGKVSVVHVPPLPYLMIDGAGNPNTAPAYVEAVQALYSLAYGLRALRKAAGEVFTVMPLEGLWWFADDPLENFVITEADKDRFLWTMLILQPASITPALVEEARDQVRRKKPEARLDAVRFDILAEGEAVQIMHLGPYADEGPNIARLHEYIAAQGWQLGGKHHEIYLNDPRKVAPEKMKTIIRQPFTRA